MRVPQLFLGACLAAMTSIVHAQFELHLAYMTERPGAKQAFFPNDTMFRFMSSAPYISAAGLKTAKIIKTENGFAVEVAITDDARRKFNSLAEANVKAQDRGDFNAHTALAVVLNGRPVRVIQGVFQHLPSNVLWFNSGLGMQEAEARKQADSWADAINKRANTSSKVK